MTKAEIIEALKVAHKELSMSAKEYADYANEKYHHTEDRDKVTSETAWAFRSGSVKIQIETILSAMEGR